MKPERFQKFFSDLYRDLVDRRLLFPLIGLVVAIVAVPFVLSSSAEPPVAPAVPQADLGGPTAVDAAVIVSDTGIRNYRQRLEQLKTKNPFDQQYAQTATDETATDPVTGSGLPDSGTPSSDSTSSGSTSSGSSTAPVDVSTGPPVDTGPPSTVPSEQPEVETSVRFFSDRVDVKVGPIGDTKTLRDVRHLDFLPDDKTPVAAFLGLAGGPDHAIFSINPSVIESGGDGSCAPKEADGCQYLNLAIGEERFFKYGFGDEAETYRLKLLDTNVVRIPDPRDDRSTDEDSSD